MSDDPDPKYLIVDTTLVRMHQYAPRGHKRRGSEDQALGRSRGGVSATSMRQFPILGRYRSMRAGPTN